MTVADLDGVVRVAGLSFPDHPEDRACFENRLTLWPAGCFVLEDDGGVAGYLIAYPWRGDAAPPLNSLIEALPADPDRLYLHDLALDPRVRGLKQTAPIMDGLVCQARADGWRLIALVAVNSAAAFWARFGFVDVASAAGYGADARRMAMNL